MLFGWQQAEILLQVLVRRARAYVLNLLSERSVLFVLYLNGNTISTSYYEAYSSGTNSGACGGGCLGMRCDKISQIRCISGRFL